MQSSSCRAPGSAAAGRLPSGSSKVSCGKRAKPEFQVLSRSNLVRPPGACLWLRSVQETCTSHLAWHLVDVSLFFRNFLLDERTGGGGSSIREPSLSGLTRFRGQIPYMAAAAIRPTLCFPGRREPFRPSIICLILLGQTARVPSARALPQPPQSAQPASSSLKPAPQVADWARGDRERHGRQCLKGSCYSACHQRCSGGPTAGMSCRPDTHKQDGGSRRSINVQ